jgi:hypothetical protein
VQGVVLRAVGGGWLVGEWKWMSGVSWASVESGRR